MDAWRLGLQAGGASWSIPDVEILLNKYLNTQCFVLKYIVLWRFLMVCCL